MSEIGSKDRREPQARSGREVRLTSMATCAG